MAASKFKYQNPNHETSSIHSRLIEIVTPAKAGVQTFLILLDTGVRRYDEINP
jgi:hypothetical protein